MAAISLLGIALIAQRFLKNDRAKTARAASLSGSSIVWPAVESAAIGSLEEGLLACASCPETARPIASIAKIITSLAILEKQPLRPGQQGPSYTVTITDINTRTAYLHEGAVSLPMSVGMKFSQYQALERVLMASDNTMADMLAERVFGSKMAYVVYANSMLQRLHLTQTSVADASGFSENTVSTASDLVMIGIAALRNPVIAKIVAQREARLPAAGWVRNTNQLLGTEAVIGIKTGTTEAAGSCLLFSAKYRTAVGSSRTLVAVILGDRNHETLYNDCRQLLRSAKQTFGWHENQATGQVLLHARNNH